MEHRPSLPSQAQRRFRIRAALLLPVLVANAGCYSALGDWTVATEHRPTTSQTVNYGSELVVARAPAPDPARDALAVRLEERPLCRSFDRGTVYQVKTRDEYLGSTPLVFGVLLTVVGVGLTIAGAVLNANSGTSGTTSGPFGTVTTTQTNSEKTAGDVGGVLFPIGIASLIGGAALLIPWIVLPSDHKAKKEEPTGEYTAWKGAAQECGSTSAVAEVSTVRFELKDAAKATIASWDAPTDDAGAYTGAAVATAKRMAAYCGAGTLLVSDGKTPIAGEDTPEAPNVGKRKHGPALEIPVSAPAPRPTLAVIANEDATAAPVAEKCCVETNRRGAEAACTARCIEAAGAGKCLNGMRACETQAKSGEFPEEGHAKCDTLLAVCLAAHATSAERLGECKAVCSMRAAQVSCR